MKLGLHIFQDYELASEAKVFLLIWFHPITFIIIECNNSPWNHKMKLCIGRPNFIHSFKKSFNDVSLLVITIGNRILKLCTAISLINPDGTSQQCCRNLVRLSRAISLSPPQQLFADNHFHLTADQQANTITGSYSTFCIAPTR